MDVGNTSFPDFRRHDEAGSLDRHPTGLGRRLDLYLTTVVRELADRGVLCGAPQRSDPAGRLLGSIVLDTTALRVDAWPPDERRPAGAGALHPDRPVPVVVTWDETTGWCAGLHHGPDTSSRRYLHPDRLPCAAVVADFVVDLALGRPAGSDHPIGSPGPAPLRLVR